MVRTGSIASFTSQLSYSELLESLIDIGFRLETTKAVCSWILINSTSAFVLRERAFDAQTQRNEPDSRRECVVLIRKMSRPLSFNYNKCEGLFP
jgi:hypothetical protein